MTVKAKHNSSLVLCTIVTDDFLDRAATVFQSARNAGANLRCIALVIDPTITALPDFEVLSLDDLCEFDSRASEAALRIFFLRMILIY